MAIEHEFSKAVESRSLERPQISLRAILFAILVAGLACGLATKFPRLTFEIVTVAVVLLTTVLVATRRHPLAFYLKYVNPVVAFIVLVICLISASVDNEGGTWAYPGFFNGPIPTYFFAKGIFCSAALFLLGKLVEQNLRRD